MTKKTGNSRLSRWHEQQQRRIPVDLLALEEERRGRSERWGRRQLAKKEGH
jgi:hypothetical protein